MSTETVLLPINLIASDPTIRQGRPHIVGTTLTVADVAIAHNYHSLNATEIAEYYDITLTQAHAALAFYFENKRQIDQSVREQIRKSERLKDERLGSRHASLLPR